jgi:hypothetical protein
MSRALTLSAVVAASWCAGHVTLFALVAPKIFASFAKDADGRESAGAMFGPIVSSWSHAGWWILGALVLSLGWLALDLHRRGRALPMALALVALVATAVLQWTGNSLIGSVRELAQHRSAGTLDAESKVRFDQLHRRSTQIVGAHTLLLAAIAVCLVIANSANSASAQRTEA